MDIRNIREKAPEVNDYLRAIFELGREQFNGYLNIEKLPTPPFNINTPKNQVILKDFTSRVIEELSEGYCDMVNIHNILNSVGYNVFKLTTDEYKCMMNSLYNINEEQVDALGFFIPLFLYSNINSSDIYSFCNTQMDIDINTTDKLLSSTTAILYRDGIDEVIERYNCYSIFDIQVFKNFNLDMDYEDESEIVMKYDSISECIPGFTLFNRKKLELNIKLLWYITHKLNIARNLLKSRPWKQTGVMTRELEYQEALVMAFLYFLHYLMVNGFTGSKLYKLFFKKQRLNLWRQRTGY